ncbi:MAG: FlgD immunoglobulin-like domain containing protein [Candidatus Coatesbacteria bacterium]
MHKRAGAGILKLASIIVVAGMVAGAARASDLLGPIWHLNGKHIGDADPLVWTIEYYDEWGRTVVDAAGGHFYHDRCCGGVVTHDPSWVYPAKYYGQYKMYYIGTTMRYRITLTNPGNRSYTNLRIVAIQEYLTNDGTWGEWISPDAAKDWYITELRSGQTVVFEGDLYIPYGAHGGLDQTHLQVQHFDPNNPTGGGAVILDDAQAAIWCPPDLQQGATAPAPGGILVKAGDRGWVQPGSGSPARIEVGATDAGQISLRIYDRRGTLAREMFAYASGEGTVVFSWDGTLSSGQPAAPGVYLVVADGSGVHAKEKLAVVR